MSLMTAAAAVQAAAHSTRQRLLWMEMLRRRWPLAACGCPIPLPCCCRSRCMVWVAGGRLNEAADRSELLQLVVGMAAQVIFSTSLFSQPLVAPLLPPTSRVQVPCLGGCSEEKYCSAACAEAAWQQYHQLLCAGPDAAGSGSTSGKGKAAAAGGSGSKSAERRQAALREFLHHADETNDVFRLAAVVLARTLLEAEQLVEQGGSPGSVEGSSCGSGSEPSGNACWKALQAAWEPFACGHKGLWWEAVSAPPDAAADMRQLAADSLELLTAALPSRLARRYPALLSLEVWGSVIGEEMALCWCVCSCLRSTLPLPVCCWQNAGWALQTPATARECIWTATP